MFVYHGYDVKDVILSNETAEDAVKRNGITLTLIYDQQLKTFDNEYWRQNNEAQALYIEYGEYDGIFCL